MKEEEKKEKQERNVWLNEEMTATREHKKNRRINERKKETAVTVKMKKNKEEE